MVNKFCVVFRNPLSKANLNWLSDICENVEAIFPNCFEVAFDGSFSYFRLCMKRDFNSEDYYLVVPKKMLLHVNGDEPDASSSS